MEKLKPLIEDSGGGSGSGSGGSGETTIVNKIISMVRLVIPAYVTMEYNNRRSMTPGTDPWKLPGFAPMAEKDASISLQIMYTGPTAWSELYVNWYAFEVVLIAPSSSFDAEGYITLIPLDYSTYGNATGDTMNWDFIHE